MAITYINGNLLDTNIHYIVHCISSDAVANAGVARSIRKKFGLPRMDQYANQLSIGRAYRDGRIINLITKKFYYNKPTYESISKSLCDLNEKCQQHNIQEIAMPCIGSGLDKLQWDKVANIIEQVLTYPQVYVYRFR